MLCVTFLSCSFYYANRFRVKARCFKEMLDEYSGKYSKEEFGISNRLTHLSNAARLLLSNNIRQEVHGY